MPRSPLATRNSKLAPWQRYVDGGRTDDVLRDILLQPELPKLKKLAEKRAAMVPSVEWLDLYQEGYLGLMHAASTFDPALGKTFWTYAAYRCLGAMVDWLRGEDPLTRNLRGAWKEARELVAALTQDLGRPASPAEIRTHLGDRLADVYENPAYRPEKRLDGAVGDWDGRQVLLRDLLAALGDDLAAEDNFEDLVRGLAWDDKCILWLYYGRGAMMQEVAKSYRLSESRISQRISQAIAQLEDSIIRRN